MSTQQNHVLTTKQIIWMRRNDDDHRTENMNEQVDR